MVKKKKRRKVKLPMQSRTMVRLGIRMAARRHIQQELLEEVQISAPGMKRLIKQLEATLVGLKGDEDVLADYGLKFYPELVWPKTVAFWRKDLCRTC